MYKTKINPRLSETNGTGHISNTTVPVWLEAGLEEIYSLFIPDSTFQSWNLILVNMNIDYLHQLFYGKEVEVQTWIKKIGNTSFTVYQELFQNKQLWEKGSTVYVNFNYGSQKPETISSQIREKLEEYIYLS
ncbi:thioesterase family protein [Bacillus sp. EB600]|uniref:acyl-CoA thioesterase n=1 Tax=Bacillus sp. EB600 TaxID=2806345 RepID=UPI00210E5816|nr:thioesterase family protein [Bacillus sp. EB600]MCQ6280925.1 acyl-CoA thioesterase [Bacillus sp. EB600]